MVTSATAGEGKTFVSANLAAALLMTSISMRFWSTVTSVVPPYHNGLAPEWTRPSDYLVGRGQLSELLMKTEMEKLTLLTGEALKKTLLSSSGRERWRPWSRN